MGKVIERVRAQQAVAFRNRLEEMKWQAYSRHLDAQIAASRAPPHAVLHEYQAEPKRWWNFRGT